MDSITTSNAISLNCNIELTSKVLSFHAAKHLTQTDESHSKYAPLSKSCQDRIGAVVNIAIDLLSYLLNLCASFGWQSAHTIYCVKFIRLNRRAIFQEIKNIRLMEHVKVVGTILRRNAQRQLHPIVKMLKWMKYSDLNDFDEVCDVIRQPNQPTVNDSNNNSQDAVNENDDTEIDSISLEILWQPQNDTKIIADVVFIHGLHGSSDSTWKQGEWVFKPKSNADCFVRRSNHDEVDEATADQVHADTNINNTATNSIPDAISQCWPKDWLPLDFPNARICAMNYDTDPYLWRPVWYASKKRSSLATRAMKMIRILVAHNIGVNRPIIWIGHSKGGLYIKQIIVNAHECNAIWLWRSSRAVLFYSVPHRGSPLAALNLPLFTRSIEMIEIQNNFSTIMELHRRFVKLCREGILALDVFSFIEMKFTELSVFYMRIIGLDSGDPGIGRVCAVPLDHLDVCKPRSRNCFLYRRLAKMIGGAVFAHKSDRRKRNMNYIG